MEITMIFKKIQYVQEEEKVLKTLNLVLETPEECNTI